MVDEPIKLFISYSHQDEPYKEELETHLSILRRQGVISDWNDRKIPAGAEWDQQIDANLKRADIILLLVSADFINSAYCWGVEVQIAMERHNAQAACVVPIILRAVDWTGAPFHKLQALPQNAQPVRSWGDRDEAYKNIAEGIREVTKDLLATREQKQAARESYKKKVEEILASTGRISDISRDTLKELQNKLHLTPEETKEIENSAFEPYKEYEKNLEQYKETLSKALAQYPYPFSDQIKKELELRQRDLGIKREDVERIEQPLLVEAEAIYQGALKAAKIVEQQRQEAAEQQRYQELETARQRELQKQREKDVIELGSATIVAPPVAQASQPVSSPAVNEVKSDVQAEPMKVDELKERQVVQPNPTKETPPVTQASLPITAPASNEVKSVQVELPKNREPEQKKRLSSTARTAKRRPIEFDWVVIPAGEFLMGSDKQKDPNARDNELPQHHIYLSEYAIARVPVTNAQYKHFVEATGFPKPSHWTEDKIPVGFENHPVVRVSWDEAEAFCEWAKVRLPTEAEWEKAARGTDGYIYPWGNEPPSETHAKFAPNLIKGLFRFFQTGQTTPVGKYPQGASPYGVLDMAGNVWEWVADLYDAKYYKNSPTVDPSGPSSGEHHVIRGGAYDSTNDRVRSSDRGHWYIVFGDLAVVGFRVVRSVSPDG